MKSIRYDVSKVKRLERQAYNPYKSPASLQEARDHFNAISVRAVISKRIRHGDYCPCCFRVKNTKEIPIFSAHRQ